MQEVKMGHFKYKLKKDQILMYKKVYKKDKNILLVRYVGMFKELIFIRVNKKINNKIIKIKYQKRNKILIYCLN